MPRKNCNARPVYRGEELWKISAECGFQDAGFKSEMRIPISEIKTTPELIVYEFRKERAQKTSQPYRIIPQDHPSIIKKIIYRINWGRLVDYLCLAALVLAVAAISGVILFGPTSLKEMLQ